jgi:hypothetical protein
MVAANSLCASTPPVTRNLKSDQQCPVRVLLAVCTAAASCLARADSEAPACTPWGTGGLNLSAGALSL